MNRYLEGTTIEELMMIRRKRFFYQFSVLSEERRAPYMKKVQEMNIVA